MEASKLGDFSVTQRGQTLLGTHSQGGSAGSNPVGATNPMKAPEYGAFSFITATLSVFWKFKSLDGDLKGNLLTCQSILKKK